MMLAVKVAAYMHKQADKAASRANASHAQQTKLAKVVVTLVFPRWFVAYKCNSDKTALYC